MEYDRTGPHSTQSKRLKEGDINRHIISPSQRMETTILLSHARIFNKDTHAEEIRTDSYKIDWRGEAARIVHGQKDQGRDILGIPKTEMKRVVNQLSIQMERQFKQKFKNINVRVG